MSRALRGGRRQGMQPAGRTALAPRLGGLAEADDAHAALQQALHQVVGGGVGVAAGQDGARVLGAPRAVRGRQHVQEREQRLGLAGAGRALRGARARVGAARPVARLRERGPARTQSASAALPWTPL